MKLASKYLKGIGVSIFFLSLGIGGIYNKSSVDPILVVAAVLLSVNLNLDTRKMLVNAI